MISERTLVAAVADGVISAGQLGRLREIEAAAGAAAALEPRDEERLRFLTGFGDVFVSIGIVLVLGAFLNLRWLLLVALGPLDPPAWPASKGVLAADLVQWTLIALLSWGLAEFFTRKRRMALPSILLLAAFCAAVFAATGAGMLLAGLAATRPPLFMAPGPSGSAMIVPGCAAAVAAWLHYRRFGVPITPAVGAAALILVVVGAVGALAPGIAPTLIKGVLLVAGIAVFALAMTFDARDPLRLTRNTDIAFWLHLLAAPLIVHTLVGGLWRGNDTGTEGALAVLGVFLALGVVAILVNRRAILVSGLVYAGAAFGALFASSGSGGGLSFQLTLLVLGGFILLLSAGWQRLRRLALGLLPDRFVRLLPPLTVSAT